VTLIDHDEHALAIISAIEEDGYTVGDGEGVKNGAVVVAPQVIVHLIPGGSIDGTLGDPDEWGDGRFQLTGVGQVARQARWIVDRAAEAIAANGVVVEGRKIRRVRPLSPWGPSSIDRDVTPPLFFATRVFAFFTFPTHEESS
jgi:hypothetical protein